MLVDVLVALIAILSGGAAGYTVGLRRTPRLIARLDPDQLHALTVRVNRERVNHGAR